MLRKAYFTRIFLKRYDSKNKRIRLGKYKVKYCTYDNFVFIFNEIFIKGAYCFSTEKSNPTIIDCGSNIGLSVLYFKIMYPDSDILAIEPDEEAFSCLQTNIESNQLKSVKMLKKAIHDKDGEITLFYDRKKPGTLNMSTVQQRLPKDRKIVSAVRLSHYINQPIDFLKMDVEGAEQNILKELIKENKLRYIKQMAIEYHHHIDKDKDTFSEILMLLEKSGFGYQIESDLERPLANKQFQDILIFAYQKQ
jgi:FkbM family methyltransferase